MPQIKKKLLQIKYSCCKLNKFAANLKRLLQMFKTSSYKLKEGGVGIMIFVFLSGTLLYFFSPGLCD